MSSADPAGLAVNEPILWEWPAMLDNRDIRRKHGALSIALGALLIAIGVWMLIRANDPLCIDRYCRRYQFLGPLEILAGIFTAAFPFFGLRLRRFLTTRYRLTASAFTSTSFGDTTIFPLEGARIVIQYRKARLERADGTVLRLTSALPEEEAARLFAAIGKARQTRQGRIEDPA